MRFLVLLLLLISSSFTFAQCEEHLKIFEHHTLVQQQDTVRFHVFYSGPRDSVSNLLLFSQGSGPSPLYRIRKDERGIRMSSSVPIFTTQVPKGYALVLVSKPGIPFCTTLGEPFSVPDEFYEKETLDQRVHHARIALDYVADSLLPSTQNVVILGHSEGSDVVAKLGASSKRVTHVGYLSGGGNSQFYDFAMLVRKQAQSGEITDEEAVLKLDSLMDTFRNIVAQRNSTTQTWQGNSYKRWFYFSEPPVENLLKIDVPLYVATGSADRAVPVESTYLIPVEFIRQGKTNLTFKVYPGLSHNFAETLPDGKNQPHWEEVFENFMEWVNKN